MPPSSVQGHLPEPPAHSAGPPTKAELQQRDCPWQSKPSPVYSSLSAPKVLQMPTLQHPPDDIAWEVHIPSWYAPRAVTTHIYLAAASLVILGAVRFLVTSWRAPRRPGPELQSCDFKQPPTHRPLGHAGGRGLPQFAPTFGARSGQQRFEADRAPRFVPLRVVPNQLRPLGRAPAMDGGEHEPWEDHYPWSALAPSRGVSSSSHRPLQGRSPAADSVRDTSRTRRSRSPRTSSRASSGKRHSGSSDGLDSLAPRRKGETPTAGSCGHSHDGAPHTGPHGLAGVTNGQFDDSKPHPGPFQDAAFPGMDLAVPRHFSRPPRPPPLTPPTLSGTFFPFEDRRPGYAPSVPQALDSSFIHQPNPEYGGCSSSTDALSSSPQDATAFPRRRSYTKSVPVGVPAPTPTASGSASAATTASGSTTKTPSPLSYPPTSSLLPSPPPGHYEPPPAPPEYEFVGGPGGPGVFLSQQEIDLQGEIISVMDDAGHGWKRHTRVYGGGVCLACVAAAEKNGGQGGFYGDKVPLEDRR